MVEELTFATPEEKGPLLSKVIDPLSFKMLKIDGETMVSGMSQPAINIYADAMLFWALNGNLSAYNSNIWKEPLPVVTNPANALKCAAEKGKCQCALGGVVYYGAKRTDGTLNTDKAYTFAEADHSSFTTCRDETFGFDPLPGQKKYCFCDEFQRRDASEYEKCANLGGDCTCAVGGTVLMAVEDERGDLDLSRPNHEIDAELKGVVKCSREVFGEIAPGENVKCYCDAHEESGYNYCEPSEQLVGCFADDADTPDFELLIDPHVFSPEHCLRQVFDNYFKYGGIKNGKECWGSNLKIGKYG